MTWALILHRGGGGLLLFQSLVGHLHGEWWSWAGSRGLTLPPLPAVSLLHSDTTTLCDMQEKGDSWSTAKYSYHLSTQKHHCSLTESIKATLKAGSIIIWAGNRTSSAYVYLKGKNQKISIPVLFQQLATWIWQGRFPGKQPSHDVHKDLV